jgi:ELWxxDGT repeat protein
VLSDLLPLASGDSWALVTNRETFDRHGYLIRGRHTQRIDTEAGTGKPAFTDLGGALNDAVYFTTTSGLWRTDGNRLERLSEQLPFDSFMPPATASRGALLFGFGSELRRLDVDGTLRSIATAEKFVGSGVAAGGLYYFTRQQELWVSDGSPSGARRLLPRGTEGILDDAKPLAAIDGVVLLSAHSSDLGNELWRSDGTDEGTFAIADIAAGPAGSDPSDPTALDDQILVSAYGSDVGRELFAIPRTALDRECREELFTCLGDGRFEVDVEWHVPASGARSKAKGTSVTADTAAFTFFDDDNVELLVKILDGRGLNDAFWTFYGGLSDVEYWITVVDVVTGRTRTYYNPARNFCGQADIDSLPDRELVPGEREGDSILRIRSAPFERSELLPVATGPCVPSATTLCLNDNRFKVEAAFTVNGQSGPARRAPGTKDSGYFWFLHPDNLELVVKVLDARPVNGHYWVFFGALSDIAYTLTVTDTQNGVQRTYRNQQGSQCGLPDTAAF